MFGALPSSRVCILCPVVSRRGFSRGGRDLLPHLLYRLGQICDLLRIYTCSRKGVRAQVSRVVVAT